MPLLLHSLSQTISDIRFMFYGTRYVTPISLTVLHLNNKSQFQQFMNSQYYMFSFGFSLRSTGGGELALCYVTSYSSYRIWTTDTQAIQEVPFKLNKTPINMEHNIES